MYDVLDKVVRLHIPTGSSLINQTVAKATLRTRFGATVLGVERRLFSAFEHTPIDTDSLLDILRSRLCCPGFDVLRSNDPIASPVFRQVKALVSELDERI